MLAKKKSENFSKIAEEKCFVQAKKSDHFFMIAGKKCFAQAKDGELEEETELKSTKGGGGGLHIII